MVFWVYCTVFFIVCQAQMRILPEFVIVWMEIVYLKMVSKWLNTQLLKGNCYNELERKLLWDCFEIVRAGQTTRLEQVGTEWGGSRKLQPFLFPSGASGEHLLRIFSLNVCTCRMYAWSLEITYIFWLSAFSMSAVNLLISVN